MEVISALALSVLEVISIIAGFVIWILVVEAILSWLLVFNVINPYSRIVIVIRDSLSRLTAPVLKPLRRFIKPVRGIDVAPLVLIFILIFIQTFVRRLAAI